MEYLPEECARGKKLKEGEAVDVYVGVVRNPRGGDLPGAKEGKVGWVVLDRKGKKVNVVDDVLSMELEAGVEVVRKEEVDVVVVLSAKEAGFCVGADIDQVYTATSYDKMHASLTLATNAFASLSQLCVPSLSILHGTTLGGGYELALHTTIRCASIKNTHIGLPEVKLGLIPGAGGVIKLPQLLGLTTAVKYILKGSVFTGEVAYENRLVDFVIPSRTSPAAHAELDQLVWDIIDRSPTIVLRRGCTKRDDWLESTCLGVGGLMWTSRKEIDKQVKARFPAPYVALTTLLKCRFAKTDEERDHYMLAATSALAVGADAKAFMRLWRVNRDINKLLPKRADTVTGYGLVVVCRPEAAAALLSVSLKKDIFSLLCGGKGMDRIDTIDKLEALLGPASAKYVPKLQHTPSFVESGVPSSSGYGLVIVLENPQDEGFVQHELSYLNSGEGSRWAWLLPEDADWAPKDTGVTPVARGNVYGSKTVVAADVVVDGAVDVEGVVPGKLQEFGCLVFPSKECVMPVVLKCMREAVLGAGVDPECLKKSLNLSKAAVLWNGEGDAPSSAVEVEEKRKIFTMKLCDALLGVVEGMGDDAASWLSPDTVDYLFVTCCGWDPRVSGPFLVMQERYGDTPLEQLQEFKHLLKYYENSKTPLKGFPAVEKEANDKAWSHSKGFFPKPGIRDLIWPIILYFVLQLVTIVVTSVFSIAYNIATFESVLKGR